MSQPESEERPVSETLNILPFEAKRQGTPSLRRGAALALDTKAQAQPPVAADSAPEPRLAARPVGTVHAIPLDLIRVPEDRLLPLDEAIVAELMASIPEEALLSPILVRPSGEIYELIAGLCRLEAHRRLDAPDILARVVKLDDNEARCAEIRDNLIHRRLTETQRAALVAEDKRVYLLIYPETKHGTAGALASNIVQGKGDAVALGRHCVETQENEQSSASFVAALAAETGFSERSIRETVQIGEGLSKDVSEALHGSSIENSKKQLLALAKLDHDTQREVVATTDLTDKTAVKAAIMARRPAPEPKRPRLNPDVVVVGQVERIPTRRKARDLSPTGLTAELYTLVGTYPDEEIVAELLEKIGDQALPLSVASLTSMADHLVTSRRAGASLLKMLMDRRSIALAAAANSKKK